MSTPGSARGTPMNETSQMIPMIEAGLGMVEAVSSHLESAGISSDISMAKDCQPGG